MNLRLKNNLLFICLFPISLFPILNYGLVTASMVIFIIGGLLVCLLSKKKTGSKVPFNFLLYSAFYLLLCLSIVYSPDIKRGLDFAVRLSPFVLIPLTLFFLLNRGYSISERQSSIVRAIFIGGCIIACIYIYTYTMVYPTIKAPWYNLIRNIYLADTPINTHPTYISACLLMAILLLWPAFSSKNRILKVSSFFISAFFLTTIFLLSSRIILVTLPIVLLAQRFKVNKLLVFSVLGLILVIAIYNVKPLQKQIKEVTTLNFQLPKNKHPSSVRIRGGIYYCALKSIKENPFFGVGLGGQQAELQKCYKTFNMNTLLAKKHNSHNFYLFLWGSAGILCLLSFIILIIHQMIRALKKGSRIELSFWILILLVNLTESFLARSYGIAFFVFFITYFQLTKPQYRNGINYHPNIQ